MIPKFVLDNPPEWFFRAPVGDNAIKLLASSYGYAYYINEAMCIYRFNVPDSATTKWRLENKEALIKRCNQFIEMLDDFNKYTNYKYDSDIELSKLTWKVQKLIISGNNQELKNNELKKYLELLPIFQKIKIYSYLYFPFIFEVVKSIKNTIRKNS